MTAAVTPRVWAPHESLNVLLEALGYQRVSRGGLSRIERNGVEHFACTPSDAYEVTALWLLRSRQVLLDRRMEVCARAWRRYGLGSEVDAALAEGARP